MKWRDSNAYESGAVSTLAAIAMVPVLLVAGLLIDIGSAWVARSRMMAAVEVSAAISAMHRPDCAAGTELSPTNAAAVFHASSGIMPTRLTVYCTEAGVQVVAEIRSGTSLMSLVSKGDIRIAAAAAADSAAYDGNVAAGWSKS